MQSQPFQSSAVGAREFFIRTDAGRMFLTLAHLLFPSPLVPPPFPSPPRRTPPSGWALRAERMARDSSSPFVKPIRRLRSSVPLGECLDAPKPPLQPRAPVRLVRLGSGLPAKSCELQMHRRLVSADAAAVALRSVTLSPPSSAQDAMAGCVGQEREGGLEWASPPPPLTASAATMASPVRSLQSARSSRHRLTPSHSSPSEALESAAAATASAASSFPSPPVGRSGDRQVPHHRPSTAATGRHRRLVSFDAAAAAAAAGDGNTSPGAEAQTPEDPSSGSPSHDPPSFPHRRLVSMDGAMMEEGRRHAEAQAAVQELLLAQKAQPMGGTGSVAGGKGGRMRSSQAGRTRPFDHVKERMRRNVLAVAMAAEAEAAARAAARSMPVAVPASRSARVVPFRTSLVSPSSARILRSGSCASNLSLWATSDESSQQSDDQEGTAPGGQSWSGIQLDDSIPLKQGSSGSIGLAGSERGMEERERRRRERARKAGEGWSSSVEGPVGELAGKAADDAVNWWLPEEGQERVPVASPVSLYPPSPTLAAASAAEPFAQTSPTAAMAAAARASVGPASLKAQQQREQRRKLSEQVLGIPYASISERYQLSRRELGKGQFGSIHTCIERSTGQGYACKTIPKRKIKVSGLECGPGQLRGWRELHCPSVH